jgi:DNA-binding LytR/AlgR family response regulator
MRIHNYIINGELEHKIYSDKRNFITISSPSEVSKNCVQFIRFEEKKQEYTWAHADEIIFGISADHYVKTLINCGEKMKWMTRHCTLKELMNLLPAQNFVRLNKFYLLNLNYFSHIDECHKLLYLIGGYSIAIPHRISPFLSHLLKSRYT